MKRYILAIATALLAFPASALASASRGVVLSVDAKHHAIQVVDSKHVVHLYHVRGRLPRLHPGTTVGFNRAGRVISHVTSLSGKSHTVVFYARVMDSSSHGLVLVTADGKVVSFAAKQIKRRPVRSRVGSRHGVRAHTASTDVQINAGNVSINILGLQPGVTVLVTETTDSAGKITITITLPSPSQTSAQQQASGVVTEVDDDAVEIQLADGSDLRLHMSSDALVSLNLSTCNTVDVSYHQDAGLLLADSVQVTGSSTTGDCTPTESATGTITQVSDQGLTISTDQGPLTFSADSDVTDGFQSGDLVDVTYTQNQDGSFTATDVEYVEQDANGTVTSVSGTSMTITDSTGQSESFVTGPNGVEVDGRSFQGVSVSDQVDVTYHQSAGQLVADSVCDGGPGGSDSNGSSGGDGSSGD